MNRTDTLHDAIAAIWPHLPIAIRDDLLALLRRLDGYDAAAEAEIYELLKTHPFALEQLSRAVADLLTKRVRSISESNSGTPTPPDRRRYERYTIVPVFYGTDRKSTSGGAVDADAVYGEKRGNGLRYGWGTVSIPDDHRMGRLERPRWWRLEFRETPDRHVVVQHVLELASERFIELAGSRANRREEPEALIFVHGYNTSFREGLQRAAQIAYDLDFPGTALLYSWPSAATVVGYAEDEANVEWSGPHFQEFLSTIVHALELRSVHIVAHSMGNRLVTAALGGGQRILASEAGARLDQVVFAAPDVDSGVFLQRSELFRGQMARCTLYASSNDKALNASVTVHGGYSRAGLAGEDILITEGIDTIDASRVDTSLIGHAYFGDNRSLLTDLFTLFKHRNSPDDRFGLLRKARPQGHYWEFRP